MGKKRLDPVRTESGYKCPLCTYMHEYAVVVWRHLALTHGYQSPRNRKAKARAPAAAAAEPACCDRPRWELLDGRYPVQAEALRQGYNEVCAVCFELRR